MAEQDQAELVFVPLGGVGEIGMNIALYGYGPANDREWLVVDCGVTFADATLPGIDLVFADISFIEKNRDRITGMIITHAHEDHYGALVDLWPRIGVSVWMTPFTAGLLEAKRMNEPGAPRSIPISIFRGGESFQIGPFAIEAIPVAHSIPEPMALAITTPLGTVIHTGDWRIDQAPELGPKTDETRFRALGEKGVAALICDSTNAMREGQSPSEQQVGEGIREVISKAKGRVAISTFSSNVGRVRSIAKAAADSGRQLLVMGRSLKRVIEVATELGYMEGLPAPVSEEDYGYIPRENLVLLCTGSQGEPRAALAKLARDEFKSVALTAGDTVVFSSRVIPGNEKAILEIKNGLIDRGIRVIEDGDALVHVSGHPRRDELRQMYDWVKPKTAVPVHGEAAHLVAHAQLARSCGVPDVASIRDGDVLRLLPGPSAKLGTVPVGRVFKDGLVVGGEKETGVAERRKLSFAGHVAINVVLDDRYELAGDPDIVPVGVPETNRSGESIEDLMLDAAVGAFDSIPKPRRKDLDLVSDAVRRAVRAAANEAWGKKPMVTVFVTR
ncbi:ribonuclease J [Mesorhizobium sp. RP14(2022)]|uniref:Ribonuclease J n=1 Tax=Mesorhizobium liriopis TaxID=2953882 RepID=A0ABT1C8A8_9HYPH|nr:ribonuclease J [Mesorhizobium liriopis]MCO6050723.1 ribonuclease J [Mesorhizobium liriopis]